MLTPSWKYQYFLNKDSAFLFFIGSHEFCSWSRQTTFKMAHKDPYFLAVVPCIIPSPLAWAGPSNWPPTNRIQSNEMSLPRLVYKETMAAILWSPFLSLSNTLTPILILKPSFQYSFPKLSLCEWLRMAKQLTLFKKISASFKHQHWLNKDKP